MDRAAIGALPQRVPDLKLLINNAGVLDFGSVLDVPREAFERNLARNFYGPLLRVAGLAPVIEPTAAAPSSIS